MEIIGIALGLLLAVAIVGAVAKWVPIPLPILQVAAGVGLSYLPELRELKVPPELFFLLFIPVLLFGDAWVIPKRDLLRVLRPVLQLAIGMVLLSTVAIGYLVHWLVPAMPLAAAFALGAVVSPTDAVAVTEVTRRLQVPARVTTIVGGESLINDASGLVAFKFATAVVVTGVLSWGNAVADFVLLSGGGFLLGLAVAWLAGQLRKQLVLLSAHDPTIQTIISLLTPYAAYFAAERLGLGGILAVVAAGLYSGVIDARNTDAPTRRHAWEVWTMVLYAFNGLVFILLGVQLHDVLNAVPEGRGLGLALLAIVVSLAVIVLRLVWVFPVAFLPQLLIPGLRKREGVYSPRNVFIVGWAGIRGALTLAAALSIPITTATGAGFPGRELIIIVAASVIVITLCVYGLTLPLFIRWLGVRGDNAAEREERAARLAAAKAAAAAIREELPRLTETAELAYARALIDEYERRIEHHSAEADQRKSVEAKRDAERRLRLAALQAERAELLQLHDTDVINDEVLRLIQEELDHVESLLAGADPHRG
jgi:CPA1 family monovalent cation:H+ antiporter